MRDKTSKNWFAISALLVGGGLSYFIITWEPKTYQASPSIAAIVPRLPDAGDDFYEGKILVELLEVYKVQKSVYPKDLYELANTLGCDLPDPPRGYQPWQYAEYPDRETGESAFALWYSAKRGQTYVYYSGSPVGWENAS